VIGVSKSNPEFFSRAVTDSGRRTKEALSVGDRIDSDVTPARAAGLEAVSLDQTGTLPGADVPGIASLEEWLDLMELPG